MDEEAAAANAIPAEHREWVEKLRHNGQLPLSPDSLHAAPNTWASPPCHVFSVRGPDYITTKAKIAAPHYLLHPLALDFLQSSSPISHIMKHPHSRVRVALDAALQCDNQPQQEHQPFVWAFNIRLGLKAHDSLIFYFVSFRSPPQESLIQRFLDGDDAFRNDRFKLLNRFPEAPWLVQAVVGERWPVCLAGKFMKCTYRREKHYMEVEVDVGSWMLARSAVRLTFGLAPFVVMDLAFVVEGTHPSELPENLLGAMRIAKLDPSSAAQLDMINPVAKGVKARFTVMSRFYGKHPHAGFEQKRSASEDEDNKGAGQERL